MLDVKKKKLPVLQPPSLRWEDIHSKGKKQKRNQEIRRQRTQKEGRTVMAILGLELRTRAEGSKKQDLTEHLRNLNA